MADLNRVTVWAEALIALHLDPEWSFGFDNAKKRAGACHFAQRRITVSRYISALGTDDEVHQTLLHEVAHAIAGHAAGHGPVWRRIARDLGYDGGATHRNAIPTQLAPWVGVCPNGHEIFRYRRPTRLTSCTACSRTYSPRFHFAWRKREVTAAARREAAASR